MSAADVLTHYRQQRARALWAALVGAVLARRAALLAERIEWEARAVQALRRWRTYTDAIDRLEGAR